MDAQEMIIAAAQLVGFLLVTLVGGRKLQREGGATVLGTLVEQLRKSKVVDLDGDGKPDSVEVLVGLLQSQIAEGVRAGLSDVDERLEVLEGSIESLTESLATFVPEVQERLADHSAAIEEIKAEIASLKEAS